MSTYVTIRLMFGAHVASRLAIGCGIICSALLLQHSFKIRDFCLQDSCLGLVSIESPLAKLSLHILNHVFDLELQ